MQVERCRSESPGSSKPSRAQSISPNIVDVNSLDQPSPGGGGGGGGGGGRSGASQGRPCKAGIEADTMQLFSNSKPKPSPSGSEAPGLRQKGRHSSLPPAPI